MHDDSEFKIFVNIFNLFSIARTVSKSIRRKDSSPLKSLHTINQDQPSKPSPTKFLSDLIPSHPQISAPIFNFPNFTVDPVTISIPSLRAKSI